MLARCIARVYGGTMNNAAMTTKAANIRIRAHQAKLITQVADLVALADIYQAKGMRFEALETLQDAQAIQNTRLYKAIR